MSLERKQWVWLKCNTLFYSYQKICYEIIYAIWIILNEYLLTFLILHTYYDLNKRLKNLSFNISCCNQPTPLNSCLNNKMKRMSFPLSYTLHSLSLPIHLNNKLTYRGIVFLKIWLLEFVYIIKCFAKIKLTLSLQKFKWIRINKYF